MNFLIDAQLPRRLAYRLREAGHDVAHTLDLPSGNRATDAEIDTICERENRVNNFDPRELVAVINVEVRPSSVRAFVSPGSHFGFKTLQVVESPVETPFVVEGHGSRE